MRKTKVKRNYKDSMFRMIFSDKKNLLELYNALNRTAYTDAGGLEVTTLENAVYMNYKNDISFIFDFELMLYEHQSSVNPNMPLRDLFYVSRVLQNRVRDHNLYGTGLVGIPAPRFVVFYNGTDIQPERQVLRLSDAYEKSVKEAELELSVTVYNINLGYNQALLDACGLLKEYAQYVDRVRTLAKEFSFREAVEKSVEDCIANGILKEFLLKNRAEAIEMSIFEYDEEKHMQSERREWHEKGVREGIQQGRESFAQLIRILAEAGKDEEIRRALTDEAFREELFRIYNI